MFALDTNTVACFFRGAGRVAERLLATPLREVVVPAIVAYELRYGVARRSDAVRLADRVETLLSNVLVLPVDDSVASVAAQLRARLEEVGRPIGPHDILIAATALAAQAVPVTRNARQFSRVPGLKVENWFD